MCIVLLFMWLLCREGIFKLLYVCYYLHVKRCEPGSLLGNSAIKITNLLLLLLIDKIRLMLLPYLVIDFVSTDAMKGFLFFPPA